MGKIDSMLLLSDYDNTLLYTEEALRDGTPRPPMSRRNLDAIARWMRKGAVLRWPPAVLWRRSAATLTRCP